MDLYDKEYNIVLGDQELYFPRTERWILDSFGLDAFEAILYQMIVNKEKVLWTYDWIGRIMGVSGSTIKRIINKMVNMQILYRIPIRINGGCRIRNILIAAYTRNGKRPLEELNRLIHEGRVKIRIEYEGKTM